jgi:hypothetical protein
MAAMRLAGTLLAVLVLGALLAAPAQARFCGYAADRQGRLWSVETAGKVSCPTAKRMAQRFIRTSRGTPGWRCKRTKRRPSRDGRCTRGTRKVVWRFAPGAP